MSAEWGAYRDTVLRFPGSGLTVDLRLPVPPSASQQFNDLGLSGPFAVVTACNPLGTPLDADANHRLATLLTSVIRRRYPGARAAHGGSPDGRHEEPGWAVSAPLEELQQLAADFLQNALFWFDGARFFIVPVLAPGTRLALPAGPPDR